MSAQRIALFGGVYGNRPALEAALADARGRGAEAVYFLGDVGGFGPHTDASAKLLRDAGVTCIQGNYDAAIAAGADDCGCGYSDPRDVRFAHIAYVYTLRHSSSEHRRWLGSLPPLGRITLGDWRLLLCHGSPRQVNEFLWETTTPTGLLERFCDGQGVEASLRDPSRDGALGHGEAELQELAMDSWGAPERVSRGYSHDQDFDLGVDRWATPDGWAGELGPVFAEAAPLPSQDGVGGHDDEGLLPPDPDCGQRNPEKAISSA